MISLGTESATEEISSAMGDGSLKGITIGEQYTLGDFGIGFCGSAIPVVDCFVAPITGVAGPRIVKLTATRVKAASIVAIEPVPTEAAPTEPATPAVGY